VAFNIALYNIGMSAGQGVSTWKVDIQVTLDERVAECLLTISSRRFDTTGSMLVFIPDQSRVKMNKQIRSGKPIDYHRYL